MLPQIRNLDLESFDVQNLTGMEDWQYEVRILHPEAVVHLAVVYVQQ